MRYLKYLSLALFLLITVFSLIIIVRLLSVISSDSFTEAFLLTTIKLVGVCLMGYAIGSLSGKISNWFESKER